MHGGTNPGPPKGSKNSLCHGIYACGLLDGEEEAFREAQVGKLDLEIKMLKIVLRRAYRAKAELARVEAAGGDGHVPYETSRDELTEGVRDQQGRAVVTKKTVKVHSVRRRRDFDEEIIRYSRAIERLERTRTQIVGGGGGGGRAQAFADLIDKMIAGAAEGDRGGDPDN